MMFAVSAETCVFAALEKLMKESWVIKTTFRESFRVAVGMIDSLCEKTAICDQKASILFANAAFIESTSVEGRAALSGKLGVFVSEKDREAFQKALVATVNTQMPRTVTTGFINLKNQEDQHSWPR